MATVGVLSLQGDFAEHAEMLERCGANAIEVRRARELASVDGLIIPGGESTTIARLTENETDPIFSAIREKALAGLPIYGTCMGSIFLSKEIEDSSQGRLAIMDIAVRRNAFGPQKFSCEQLVEIPALGPEPFPAVFIRAPIIVSCGPQVEVLSRISAGVIMARQGNLLVTAFHPEVTEDIRIHQYFLAMVGDWQCARPGLRTNAVRLTTDSGVLAADESCLV